MKKYGRIIGIEKLGDSGYTKYHALVFSTCGFLGFDEFLSNEQHPYCLRDIVQYRWSKKHDRVYQCRVADDGERDRLTKIYFSSAQALRD